MVVIGECRYLFSKYIRSSLRCVALRNYSSTSQNPALTETQENVFPETRKNVLPDNYRYKYQEFLPDPNVEFRNAIREKLERQDMLTRRTNIDIPEFYVGSILAVSTSDQHSPGKNNRFVGICIQRDGCGLRTSFILRNVIDHQGVEFKYALYSPIIQRIEVLRLEKRLDSELFYLRDAPPEFSTFPYDMEPEFHPAGQPVPINTLKVTLNPRPWFQRYERMDLQGAIIKDLPDKFYKRAAEVSKPWEKYDLVDYYRKTIPEEEQSEVFSEVYSQLSELEQKWKISKQRKVYSQPPNKKA